MKVKVDYVTNSSSEVFGVVVQDAALIGGLIAILAAAFEGCKIDSEIAAIKGPQAEDLGAEAEEIARVIADAALKDAERQDNIVSDAYKEAEDILDSAKSSLERELEELRKAWAESDKTADKTDPAYDDFNKQYEEYVDYLESQIQEANLRKELVQAEKAEFQAQKDSQDSWIKERQADYIAIKEEKAMLEAVAKGYDKPGYDTAAVHDRLKQLNAREKELEGILDSKNASIDYKAAERDPIGPSKESLSLTNKIREERAAFEKAAKNADAKRRAELEAQMVKNIEEYKAAIKSSNRYDMALSAAETVQVGADLAVDGLSYVTGPAGQQVKLAYTASKGLASGIGEGMADPENAGKHLAKGILNAGTEVIKDKFSAGNKPWQEAATGIFNEGLQSAIDASIKGEDVMDSLGKGLTKGVFEAGVDKGLDAIKNKLPIPKGTAIDASNVSVGNILSNNPLATNILKEGAKEVSGGFVKDQIKDTITDQVGKEAGFIDSD